MVRLLNYIYGYCYSCDILSTYRIAEMVHGEHPWPRWGWKMALNVILG